MGSGLVRIDSIRLESSLGFHIQIRPDPEGTVSEEKAACSLFCFFIRLDFFPDLRRIIIESQKPADSQKTNMT
jgi:hypothetical protein